MYYTTAYYDAADRLTDTVDVGTYGGTTYTRLSSAPTRSDTALVTSYTYNDAGWVDTVTDPRGIVSKSFYNNQGQTIDSVAAWDGSYDPTGGSLPSSGSQNQTTKYTYDGDGHVLTMKAILPSTQNSQTTQYLYGVSPTYGSAVYSNDLLLLVAYPDPSSGAPSTTTAGQNQFTYNAAGQVLSKLDQNGTPHTYSYDVLGRQILDFVNIPTGSAVDRTVQSIGTTYDTQGNIQTITSYSTTTPDAAHIVNQIQRQYNGLGQLIQEWQSVSGPVNTDPTLGTVTPSVQYSYDLAIGGRLSTMTYPNGRVLTYNYGAAGSVDNATSRLVSLSDNTGILESYTYLGDGTLIQVAHPQVAGGGLTLSYGTSGDSYSGLDRFGRTLNQTWTVGGTLVDGYGYTYDRDSNVQTKTNLAYAVSHLTGSNAFDEGYTYDALNRLGDVTRGGLNLQQWGFDALGNWSSFTDTTQGLDQTRTSNTLNEVSAITTTAGAAWVTPTYDANGNQISGPVPGAETTRQFYTYDAWNRLVTVKTDNAGVAGATLATYKYDGRGYRIQKAVAGSGTLEYYQNAQNQVLEVRQTGASSQVDQYVWSARYMDAPVLVYSNVNSGGVAAQTIYFVQDANFNVTALVDGATGVVLARKVYSPYGAQTLLTGDWSSDLSSLSATVMNTLTNGPGFQGLFRDAETGLIYSRARYTNPSLGTFMTPEPSGGTPYVDGINLDEAYADNPINFVDPLGLAAASTQPAEGDFVVDDLGKRPARGIEGGLTKVSFGDNVQVSSDPNGAPEGKSKIKLSGWIGKASY